MSISVAQYKKYNADLHNGFQFNLWSNLMHGDCKEAVKKVPLENGKYLEARIGWYNVSERWSRDAVYAPKLALAIYSPTHTEGVYSSCGMGALVQLSEETVTRRNWKKLAAYTADWTDEKLLEAMEANISKLNDPVMHFGGVA